MSAVRAAVSIGELGRDVALLHERHLAGKAALVFTELFQVIAHVVPPGRVPAIGSAPQAEIVPAIQVPFADISGLDTVVAEALANCLDVGAKRQAVSPAPVRMGIQPGEKRRTRRSADRLAGIGAFEAHPLAGKPVQVRG